MLFEYIWIEDLFWNEGDQPISIINLFSNRFRNNRFEKLASCRHTIRNYEDPRRNQKLSFVNSQLTRRVDYVGLINTGGRLEFYENE